MPCARGCPTQKVDIEGGGGGGREGGRMGWNMECPIIRMGTSAVPQSTLYIIQYEKDYKYT